jgi:hypothetical protein
VTLLEVFMKSNAMKLSHIADSQYWEDLTKVGVLKFTWENNNALFQPSLKVEKPIQGNDHKIKTFFE